MKARLLILALCTGCSVLVDPDPGRLGGETPTGCADGCSDGVACTADRCVMDACVNTRMDSLCDEGFRCDAVRGCVDACCTDSAQCDDGLLCNGAEICTAGVCAAGSPVECDDGNECTVDACDAATGTCASTPNDALCDDGFECTRDTCGASGCEYEANDAACDDGFCFTGARCVVGAGCSGGDARDCGDGDDCTTDRCDPAAMACVNDPIDADGDGALCGDDCNDGNVDIAPGVMELCDMVDQDCDGNVDEGACVDMLPDTCETVRPLALSASPTRVTGDYGDFESDYQSDCGREGGPDAVYSLTVPAGMDLRIEARGTGGDPGGDPVLAVSDTCGSFDFAGHGCNDDISPSNRDSRLWIHRLSGETLYLLVDRYQPGGGGFEVTVTAFPQTTDTCGAEFDLTGGGAVVGRIPGDAVGTVRGTCQNFSERFDREATFRFERAGVSSARLEAWSDSFTPDLYSRFECGDSGDIECDEGSSGSANIDFGVSGAITDYSVILDGRGLTGDGLYTLRFNPG